MTDSELDTARMRLALAQAEAAAAAGEVPVGAVLFLNDRQIAAGQNRALRDSDPSAHAEIVALRAGGRALDNYRLLGSTLYCTLEPCSMCAGAMIHARIERLVYGTRDPKAGANGSVLAVLNHPRLNHRIAVENGVLEEECGDLLRGFFRERRADTSAATPVAEGIEPCH